MNASTVRMVPGALAMLERAVFLLRRNSGTALGAYYLGSLPFVLAVLYFWSDMSRNPYASWHNAPAAFGLAVLFVWMKFWHVRYCRRLWHALGGTKPQTFSWQRWLSVAARQTAMHASAMIILPLAAITAVPLAWAYAFYQNLCVLDDTQTKTLNTLTRDAFGQCILWPGQNHILLAIVTLFSLVVLLNLRIGMLLLPYLVKWLFGVDTVFTLSGAHLLNTTYLAVMFAITYLCVDPIIKAVYVLRCFYGVARVNGEDLKAALRPFTQTLLILIMLLALCLPAGASQNHQPQPPNDAGAIVDQQAKMQQLDRAIDSTLKQRRFAWRLPAPEETVQPPEQSWLAQSIAWLSGVLRSVFKTVGGWIKDLFGWLKKIFPDPKFSSPDSAQDWSRPVRLIFYVLGAVLICILLFVIVRWIIRRRSKDAPKIKIESVPTVDIDDQDVTASDLPTDGWLSLAEEFIAEKSYRKAMRALYLSILASLADQHRLVIARYKSNWDYVAELTRRAHVEPDLLKAFRWCVQHFERSWYGLHPVAPGHLDQFKKVRERITHGVRNQV